MKPSLQLRVSQHLALTPQLQQSIRLLQLSTLELQQELSQILSDNPLLERLDDPLDGCVRIAPDGMLDSGQARTDGTEFGPASGPAPPAEPETAYEAPPAEADLAGVPDRADGSGSDAGDSPETADSPLDGYDSGDWSAGGGSDGQRGDAGDDDRERLQLVAVNGSLRDHLMGQLQATQCTVRDRALITLLIEELDEAGWLQTPLEEMIEALPAELDILPEEMSAALKLLQSFDPVGVGARGLPECLLLQLDAMPASERGEMAVYRLARAIARDYLGLLAAHDFTRLKRQLRCDDEALRAAHALIRRLDPRPGARFGSNDAGYVVPDVIVRRTRFGWQAFLNPDVMPRLRINDAYAQILKRNRGASGLSSQLQEARWLIKNVQQRFDTILRVAQAIVDRQKAFFTHGEVAMRPLILREIADTLGLHESTISRVTTQKYMLTPAGTLELKYFFGSHVATDSGGAASSTAIRALIRQLVSAEDPAQPLSDSRIAELLGEQGIVVARRTVAKYREALRIAPVAQRKAL